MASTKQQSNEPRDVMVILNENGTADILPVLDMDHERILSGGGDKEMAIPNGDIKTYIGSRGRIFVYPSTVENISDCQRIAELEKSTVLRHITQYEPPPVVEEDRRFDISKLLPWLIILVLVIFVGVK